MQVEHGGPDDGGWFVTMAADGRVVGDCGTFGPPGEDGRVEIGYGLAAPFRGQGIGTEAVRALVDWLVTQAGRPGRDRLGRGRQRPVRRLLERLGFTLTDGPAGTDRHWHLDRPA
jgi:RimJ/RimL family protein N-acetyltransferase